MDLNWHVLDFKETICLKVSAPLDNKNINTFILIATTISLSSDQFNSGINLDYKT